nr:MAG TPA: hypothetical protein [Herelleviridae sp.]
MYLTILPTWMWILNTLTAHLPHWTLQSLW